MSLNTLRAEIKRELQSKEVLEQLSTSQLQALTELAYPEKIASKKHPKSCPGCHGTGWRPTLEQIGAFLKEDHSVKYPCDVIQ